MQGVPHSLVLPERKTCTFFLHHLCSNKGLLAMGVKDVHDQQLFCTVTNKAPEEKGFVWHLSVGRMQNVLGTLG
jgi:hypothetical protein